MTIDEAEADNELNGSFPDLDDVIAEESYGEPFQLRCSGKRKGNRVVITATDDTTGAKVKLILPNLEEATCNAADSILAAMPQAAVQVMDVMADAAEEAAREQ